MKKVSEYLSDRAEQEARFHARWAKAAAYIDPLAEELAALFGERLDIEFTTDLDLRFTGDKHFLADVIRVVRRHGFEFECDEDRPKEGQPNWTGRLVKKQTDSAGSYRDRDAIPVWVSFTSNVCKRVKTGEKTVTVDVFEIQCE